MGTVIAVSEHEARYVEAGGEQKPQTKRKVAYVAGAALKKTNESKPRRDNKNLTGQPRTGRLPEGQRCEYCTCPSTTRAGHATPTRPGRENCPIQ